MRVTAQWREQLAGERHIEADAVVAHVVHRCTVDLVAAELDTSGCLPRGEFPRVAEQVIEPHAQQLRITLDHQVIWGHEAHRTTGLSGL
ncbi:MAG: hypothetical protein H7138_05710 [Myxococcales bacterium]|nr:hypothetical protein [Myxococcales bacterium]